jgi:hypothetical protein
VKKSRSVLKLYGKLLGTSQDMQVADDSAAAQTEEVFALCELQTLAAQNAARFVIQVIHQGGFVEPH